MMDALSTQRQMRDIQERLERLEKSDIDAIRLSYAQRVLNPFPLASSGAGAGDFGQAEGVEILAFRVSVFVQTTNNASNFWTISLVNTAASVLASVSTSAIAAATWTRLVDTTITQPSSTNVVLTVIATATLSPGAIFIVPEVVVL